MAGKKGKLDRRNGELSLWGKFGEAIKAKCPQCGSESARLYFWNDYKGNDVVAESIPVCSECYVKNGNVLGHFRIKRNVSRR